MPYVTSVERIGIRKGIQQGLEQGLEQGRAAERQLLLRLTRKRFGDTSAEAITPLLAQIQDTAVLEDLADLLLDCDNGVEWLAAVQGKVFGA